MCSGMSNENDKAEGSEVVQQNGASMGFGSPT